MLGLWQAFNPASYVFDYPLVIRKSALDWLKADCQGAAVVIPKLSARTFLDITDMGGRFGGQDAAHANELKGHLTALIDQVEIVAPKPIRRAA